MKHTQIACENLIEYENNPRKISASGLKKLQESLSSATGREFFNARPLIVSKRENGELFVIAGNQRLKAAQSLGWTEVPCIVFDNLTEQQEKEILIKDNVSAGDWDFSQLKEFEGIDTLASWGIDDRKFYDKDKSVFDFGKFFQEQNDDTPEKPATPVKLADCFDKTKADEKIALLKQINAPQELIEVAQNRYFSVDYDKLAVFYTHFASPAEKKALEILSLVFLLPEHANNLFIDNFLKQNEL